MGPETPTIRRKAVAAAAAGALFFLAGLCPSSGRAAEDPVRLGQIVVSTPRAEEKLVNTPASITVLTAGDIEKMGARSIVDVVARIPGVVPDSSVRDEVTIRGNRGPQSPGALVLVDGVPANSGLGSYVDYTAIPLSDIERVEVLRSTGSILYGPDASRGVIHIITKRGVETEPRATVRAFYGSWNTAGASAEAAGRKDRIDYSFGASVFDTQGYEKDEKERQSARIGLGFNAGAGTRLGLNLSWRDAEYQTIYGKSRWQVENHRRDNVFPTSAANPTRVNHRENEDENLAASLDFRHERGPLFLDALLSFDTTDHVYRYLKNRLNPAYNKASGYYDYEEDQDQDRIQARVKGGYRLVAGDWGYTPVVGADYEKCEYDQSRAYPWSPAPPSAAQVSAMKKAAIDYERERWGLFWENGFDFQKRWELTLAGRVDEVTYEVGNRAPKQVSQEHTDYSWSVTPAFHPAPDATIFLSASRSYWYPVAYYYKYAMEKASPLVRAEDLGPEAYTTWEIGYKHAFGPALNLALTGYFTRVEGKYLSFYDGASWKGYKNVGESEHRGIEVEASGRLAPFVGYRLSGAWQDAEWQDATFRAYVWGATPAADTRQNLDISGYPVPHVPEITGNAGLDFFFLEYFKLSTDLHYTGTQAIDVLNRYEMDDYVTADARLSYARGKYTLWLQGKNIFDRQVDNRFNEGGKRNADGTADHLYYPVDGAYVEMGMSIAF